MSQRREEEKVEREESVKGKEGKVGTFRTLSQAESGSKRGRIEKEMMGEKSKEGGVLF